MAASEPKRGQVAGEMEKDAASEPRLAEPQPQQATVLADEKAQVDTAMARTTRSSSATSPPASPPSTASDYYSSRPKFDRLGNPIPERKQPGAMSAVYGKTRNIHLPGDLGAKDPRRPRSPAPPAALPGDLGPNDPRRPKSPAPPSPGRGHNRQVSLEGSEGGVRLEEDPPLTPSEERRHESDDDADADNDNDTDREDGTRGRGRRRPEPGRTTSGKSVGLDRDESVDSEMDFAGAGGGTAKPDPTKGQSKFTFVPGHAPGSKDPKIRITPPSEKKRVHPTTAFDVAPSGASTPLGGSDDESHSELRAAQKLSLTMSAIHSTPSAHRVIRQIIRGDYAHFQREAEEGRKRQRMYLVATDLSPESEYALEWTIGTVLRDGDTLFAVYAVDEESAKEGGSSEGGVEIGHGAESVRDTAAIVKGLPATNVPPPSPGPSPLARNGPLSASANNSSADIRSRSRGVYSSAEMERRRAAENISQRCIHILRKTRLQVRIVVEAFHCKSPRHMITELIDYLSPTLVIIGSRGRSNVKGVLLGSFSNYLVTKSSQPVMVARKKLRKHSKAGVRRNKDGTVVPYSGSGRTGRMTNLIEAPKNKGLRVRGWDEVGID